MAVALEAADGAGKLGCLAEGGAEPMETREAELPEEELEGAGLGEERESAAAGPAGGAGGRWEEQRGKGRRRGVGEQEWRENGRGWESGTDHTPRAGGPGWS